MAGIIQKILEENKKWRDIDYCMQAVKEESLKIVATKIQTLEICTTVVQESPYILQYIKIQTPEICLAAVQKYGIMLQYVKHQTPEICIAAVKETPEAWKYIKSLTFEIFLKVIGHSQKISMFCNYFSSITDDKNIFNTICTYLDPITIQNEIDLSKIYYHLDYIKLPASKQDRKLFIKKMYLFLLFGFGSDIAKKVVKKLIKNHIQQNNPKHILKLITGDASKLTLINNQTLEICLAAIQKNERALAYIKKQTLEICSTAIKQNPFALQYIKIQTPEICETAVEEFPQLLLLTKIQTPEIYFKAIKQNPEAYKYIRLPEDGDKKDKFLRELGLLLLAM